MSEELGQALFDLEYLRQNLRPEFIKDAGMVECMFDDIKKAIESNKPAEWLPIETCPYDEQGGTPMILISRFDDWGNVIYIHASFKLCNDWFLHYAERDENEVGTLLLNDDELPTHWQPLPEPPKGK